MLFVEQLPAEEVVVDQVRSKAALGVVVTAQEGGLDGSVSWLATGGEGEGGGGVGKNGHR
jgi:hypothetical protein